MPGTLYIVATPIGNLEDITYRAVRVLRECSVVACEDTRQSRKLLDHYGIARPTVSYHDHNEASRTAELLERLGAGEDVALVSDAGTPLFSDPGYRLVHAAIEAAISVVPIPGPCAATAALTGSGFDPSEFRFCGFLPAKGGQRLRRLEELAAVGCTLVFYEAPHRILETLADVEQAMGDREVVLARELTKLHEEFLRGSASSVRTTLAARPAVKGEMTLLIAPGKPRVAGEALSDEESVLALERTGVARMDAVKQVAHERDLPKRELYRRMLEYSPPSGDRAK